MGNYWTSENEGGESYVADWSTVKPHPREFQVALHLPYKAHPKPTRLR